MVNCSVFSCKRRSSTSTLRMNGVSYHMFPRDPLWQDQWIKFCNNKPGWKPSRNSVVCSDHFSSSCWLPNIRRKLVDGAIPTIYVQGSKEKKQVGCGNIMLGPGDIPTPAQIEKLIDVHPQIRKLRLKLDMKQKKIKRLQSRILYMQKKLTFAEDNIERIKIDAIKYRQLQLRMKKKRLNRIKVLENPNQMIPSVMKVVVMKRALFNT